MRSPIWTEIYYGLLMAITVAAACVLVHTYL